MNGFISDLDEESIEIKYCPRYINDLYDELINEKEMMNKCQQLCPKDCVFIKFRVTKTITDSLDYSRKRLSPVTNTIRTKLLWNTRAPMLYYVETPVMSFIELLCYCGGLFGLLFAADGKLFTHIIPDWLRDKFHNLRLFNNFNF